MRQGVRPDRAAGMLVGAAVGDAAGWPFERADRARGREEAATSGPAPWFVAWRRNAGNRFRPFLEDVAAGEYSDDTQMAIAVARARLTAGDQWPQWLERVEWPFLMAYERGAGATVKRACRAWTSGRAPWAGKPDDRRKYFASGANGAAMRIAPHVIAHHADASFDALADDVLVDGATTHGHPRALLGALVHAYALWMSAQGASSSGQLIEVLIDGAPDWGRPVWQRLDEPWRQAARGALDEPYERLWEVTCEEVLGSLHEAAKALAEDVPDRVIDHLTSWGLTKRASNGSGTLCATAAVYLAARYAADPEQAVLIATRLPGADTDTLASMTTSLLGAGLGTDWLGGHVPAVQDSALLTGLATALLDAPSDPVVVPAVDDACRAVTGFEAALASAEPGAVLTLPGARRAEVLAAEEVTAGSWQARRTRVRSTDGQSMVLLHGVRRV